MRRSYLICFIILFSFIIHSCDNDPASGNNTTSLDSDHFSFVLYDGLTSSQFEDVAAALEQNYARILSDLQVQRMDRITVKIWNDYAHFLDDMENDIGTRYTGATGYIFGRTEFRMYNTGDVSLTAVHEFAHIVSLYVNPTISNNPRWLWEAVAIYESGDFTHPNRLPYMVSGDYPTLDELSIDYNSSDHSIYSLGYVLLEYIIETWDNETMIQLIRENGDIPSVLGITVAEFENGWYQYLEATYLGN